MKKITIALLLFGIYSCDESPTDFTLKAGATFVEFEQSSMTIIEDEASEIAIQFNKKAASDGVLEISIENISATYDVDYNTIPSAINDVITLQVAKGDSTASFTISPIIDGDDEVLKFVLSNAEGGVSLGNVRQLTVSISSQCFEFNSQYASCLLPLQSDELSVVTWNLKFFPTNGNTTLSVLKEMIENMDADVIAVQEINDIGDFNKVIASLCGWEGKIVNLSGSLDIGYIYKTSEIVSFTPPKSVVNAASPRPAVETTIVHKNGLKVTLLNIHLKCCSGSSNVSRRRSASIAIKSYIDENLANENVIVLGDFNDDIDLNLDTPFANFINDTNNYWFADTEISAGNSANWSYPSWPSMIDHILITNELMDNLIETKTLKLKGCYSKYASDVSDHRPILATFKKD